MTSRNWQDVSIEVSNHDVLDPDELAIISVLQRQPRLSWAQIGPLVGLSPQSAAQKWASLTERNLAWASLQHAGTEASGVTAFLGINHLPSAAARVQAELIDFAPVQSIEYFAQGRDLIMTVMTPTLQTLVRDVVDPIRAIEGVSALRTWVVSKVHAAGYSQRLPATRAEPAPADPAERSFETHLGPPHLAIAAELMKDGRMGVTEIARNTGIPISSAHRYLRTVLDSPRFRIRIHVANTATGYPTVCQWFARLPGDRHAAAAARLATLPNLRMISSVTGQTNFVLAVAMRSVNDVFAAEREISALVPDLVLVESLITLSTLKRWGWELDDSGRRTGRFVPPPLW